MIKQRVNGKHAKRVASGVITLDMLTGRSSDVRESSGRQGTLSSHNTLPMKMRKHLSQTLEI